MPAEGANVVGSIAVVVAGGPIRPPDPGRTFDAVVAVDGGLDAARAAGWTPTHVVGDFDSVSATGALWAVQQELEVEQHPRDKDATDTALALALLDRDGLLAGNDLLLVGGGTGAERLDHVIGTLAALGHPALAAAASVTASLGTTVVHVVHPGRPCAAAIGAGRTFSVLALHGLCAGVHVEGAKWPLVDASLTGTSTLGISNEAERDVVDVRVGSGVLTVIVPEDAR